jgi:hypothetical protein
MPREATALQVHVVLTPAQLALIFCEFNEEEQAAFFTSIGRLASVWQAPGASMQWWRVGRFLRDHAESTYVGKRVVLDIAEGLAE